MLLQEFNDRAAECLKLADAAASRRDRDFLVELALAWYGLADEPQHVEMRQAH
jgi:hypothetical protein